MPAPTAEPPVEFDSSVRVYARQTRSQRARRRWLTRHLGAVGEGVYLEPDVRFLRHPENITLGADVIVKEGSRLCPTNPRARISVGESTTLGHHTFIFASVGIEIGRDCLIAPFCYLVDSNHGIRRDQLIRNQKMTGKPITIGNDVWLGCSVTVLFGVEVGDGAVIGAGAVVTQDVPEYAVLVGNPGRVIGYRE